MPWTGNGAALGDAIAAAVFAANPQMTAAQKAQFQASWEIVGIAMINWLLANQNLIVTGVTAGSDSTTGSFIK